RIVSKCPGACINTANFIIHQDKWPVVWLYFHKQGFPESFEKPNHFLVLTPLGRILAFEKVWNAIGNQYSVWKSQREEETLMERIRGTAEVPNFEIVQWNCTNASYGGNLAVLTAYLASQSAEFICLQEVRVANLIVTDYHMENSQNNLVSTGVAPNIIYSRRRDIEENLSMDSVVIEVKSKPPVLIVNMYVNPSSANSTCLCEA